MWHRAFEAIQFGPVPVVAVLHGAVVGGGLELAASTHIRVAERSAYYGLPEGQRGIFLGGGGSVRIARLIGVAARAGPDADRPHAQRRRGPRGRDHAISGRRRQGPRQGDRARRQGGRPTRATTNFAVLHALPRIFESDPASGLLTESLMAAIAETSPEAKQRLKDFLEKRAAKVLRPELKRHGRSTPGRKPMSEGSRLTFGPPRRRRRAPRPTAR